MSADATAVPSSWYDLASRTPRPPFPKRPSPQPATTLTSVERALKASLSPPEIRDVRLYAFSRRVLYSDGTTRIDCPQPILAIGSVLKETEHFSKLLTSGFSETNPDALSQIRQYAHESEYDYETDSDLDEFEEPETLSTPVAGPSAGSSSRSKGKSKDDGETAEDEARAQSKGVDMPISHQILIPSIAHRTLMACVFFLYSKKINFLPLTSEGASQRAFALLTASEYAPPCSPKSMFRLAESYGMTDLQDLAYDAIVSRLKPENIVQEAFSSFFARYDRLREHAVSYLSQHYSKPAIQSVLPEVIERVVLGDMPHAGGVLRSLLGLRVTIAAPFPAKQAAAVASSGGQDPVDFEPEHHSCQASPAVPTSGSFTELASARASWAEVDPSIEEYVASIKYKGKKKKSIARSSMSPS
ncbi:hypothetical protein C8T65DRAFT_667072 [Cerioporus squamosus]|nr:hypothetical protein C8T65DRAFT_667072 [Cerioporus squamosus]